MADASDDKEVVGYKDVILSEVIQSEALVNILVRKGILTQDELLEEIINVKKRMITEQATKIKFKQ